MIFSQIIGNAVLTGTTATYYQCAANNWTVIQNMTLCNTTAGAVSCTIYLVPQGATAGTGSTIIGARSVAAGATDRCPELVGKALNGLGTIQAKGNGVSIDGSALIGP
jgi:hypothetical protein